MKMLLPLILISLCAGCVAQREPARPSRQVSGTTIPAAELPEVRTPETVKAYPVGRYTDPNFPNEMHERHTVYRREQASDWNYQSNKPYALPLGPVVARSNSADLAKTDAGQISAQQKAYADALLEQNAALKKRIDALQQENAAAQKLESENEKLRSELQKAHPSPTPSLEDDPLSGWFDPCEIMLFPRSDEDCRAYLISQMRLNDELSEELAARERARFQSLFSPFPRYLAFISTITP